MPTEVDPKEFVVPIPNEQIWKFFGMIERFPKNIRFATQNKDEIIYATVRRHIIKNAGWFFNLLLLSFLPFLIVWIIGIIPGLSDINSYIHGLLSSPTVSSVATVIQLLYNSSLITYGFIKYLDWFFDIDIITNHRVICVDYRVLAGRTVAEAPLKDIIDLSEKKIGVMPAVFNYGIVSYRTSSEHEVFMVNVPVPTWIRDVISDLVKYFREQRYDRDDEDETINIVHTRGRSVGGVIGGKVESVLRGSTSVSPLASEDKKKVQSISASASGKNKINTEP